MSTEFSFAKSKPEKSSFSSKIKMFAYFKKHVNAFAFRTPTTNGDSDQEFLQVNQPCGLKGTNTERPTRMRNRN